MPERRSGAEQRFQSVVDVDGRPVRLTGFADRLEIDDAGRVFKAGSLVALDGQRGYGQVVGVQTRVWIASIKMEFLIVLTWDFDRAAFDQAHLLD